VAFSTSQVFAVALIGALMSGSWLSTARADEPSAAESSVAAAKYSMGERGSKLKWLPYRPGKLRSDNRVVAAAHYSEAGKADNPVRTAQLNLGPIPNPFGRPAEPPEDAPASATVDDQILEGRSLEPQPQEFPATVPDEGPSVAGDEPEPAGEEGAVAEPDLRLEPFPGGSLPDLQLAQEAQDPCTVPPLRRITDIEPLELMKPPPPPETPAGRQTQDVLEIYCKVPESDGSVFDRQHWAGTTYTWKASGLCHKPLYFEDVHLERYGHSWGPILQPILSGAHFFLTVPALPYKAGLYPPGECIYTLGQYRPGSCAPYMLDPIPLSVRAGLVTAATYSGMIYAIP
jgi:hypothetical protein